jgi:hypothetical protein
MCSERGFIKCDACVEAEGNHLQHMQLTELKFVYPDSRQIGIAASAALPAVTRNCLSQELLELSDKIIFLYLISSGISKF